MCKNCYEKFVKCTGKTMLLCKQRPSVSTNEINQLCCFQYFCPDKDRYVADGRQDTECKFYK